MNFRTSQSEVVAMLCVMFLTFVTLASGASLRADTQTSQGTAAQRTEANVTCVENKTCKLNCSAEGEVQEFHWYYDESLVPVASLPPIKHIHKHVFSSISSVSLEQPGGGAVLQLRGVQMKHEGRYWCKVIFRSGVITYHFVNLKVEDPPDGSHLHFLWMLLILVPVAAGLLYFCRVKLLQIIQDILFHAVNGQSTYNTVPGNPPDASGKQNGHQNGLKKASASNGLPNGKSVTSV